MATILISGGTGLVGQALTKRLTERDDRVHILTRSNPGKKSAGEYHFLWDLKKGTLDPDALKGVDGIVHLAGAGIADKRWSPARKKQIIDSRVKSAELLKQGIRESGDCRFFITASGSNYYGTKTTEKIFEEDDPAGDDFLGMCCIEWEGAAFDDNPADRVVAIRTGVVLSNGGGALEKLAAPVKWGFGAPLGSGKQYMPWIHLDDLVSVYLAAIDNSQMKGAYNAVADEHLNQKELTKAIAIALKRPLWLPNVPAFALKIALGEMSEMLLKGSRLSNKKLRDTGFKFRFSEIQPALNDLLRTP